MPGIPLAALAYVAPDAWKSIFGKVAGPLKTELEQGQTTTWDALAAETLPPRQTPETALAGLYAGSLALAQTGKGGKRGRAQLR